MAKQQILSIIAENHSGVLLRVVGLFSRRGYSIESISAAETENSAISRMTIVTRGDDATIDQICKQLRKLVEVHDVHVLTSEESVGREHVLLCAGNNEETRATLMQMANLFHAQILHVSETSLMLELTGEPQKIDAFIALAKPMGIVKMVRSGLTALERD